jgi:chaperonin GroES
MGIVLRPLSDRVVIKPDPIPEVIGSIINPRVGEQRSETGTIKWIGPGYVTEFPVVTVSTKDPALVLPAFPRMPMELTVGMRVMYGKYVGAVVTVGGEEFVIVRQTEVLGVLEEEDD